MTQDTRKDPRAKIVSLNVRYKSATVDEFIENHSHDVSKGGIFIKTSTPFPQGTLLKFEIRLSGDQAVIAGVGRVVWKREASTSGTESPAGMGVKFIKIDENSRAVIDRLVGAKENAGIAFTSELEKKSDENAPAAAAALNSTLLGTGAPASGTSAPPRAGAPKTKSTIMGMGAVKDPTPAPGAVTPAAGAGFFPPTNSQADMPPPEERTMMKQAAELLEEALKGAGGSMDEIGTNPLFAGPAAAAAKTASPATPDAKKDQDATSPPSTVRDTPIAKESAPAPISKPPAPAPASVKSPRPVAAVARASEPTPPLPTKKFPAWAWAPILLVVAGGLAFALKPDLFGGGSTTVPTPTPAPSTPVSVAPVDSVVPTAAVDAAIAAVSDASALGVLGAKDAAAAKDSAPPTAAVVTPPVIAPPVVAPPIAKPPPPVAPPKPPTPTVTPDPPVDNTPKPTPVPKPAPPPKKPADDSDNPY